jgi:hypothetical protein
VGQGGGIEKKNCEEENKGLLRRTNIKKGFC